MMKRVVLAILCACSCATFVSAAPEPVGTTAYFTFHNDPRVNLHHFLYEQASGRQAEHLRADGLTLINIGDIDAIAKLTVEERRVFDEAVAYYREHVITKQLLHSGEELKWLQSQPKRITAPTSPYGPEFITVLNQLAPIYTQHFWPHHERHNRELFESYHEIIQVIESAIIPDMERLSGSTWEGRVRVDLTTYGNWASAYSPADDNIVVSSIDPALNSTLYLEFIFHEGSHLLFSRQSPFRYTLWRTARELDIKLPRGLWHAAMFYLSGLSTQAALAQHEVPHELIMPQKDVFPSYYQDAHFRKTLEAYYQAEITIAAMATALLDPSAAP